jgi:dihydrofolate reductase
VIAPLTLATNHYQSPKPRRLSMRKIKSYFFISLDGVVESPDQWHFPYFDDQMGEAVGAGFATADAMLMGRVLYDEWAAYWPEHADEPFGDVVNGMKKYVVSNNLQSADWQNSEIIRDDVAQRLNEIKAGDGGDITISGSATTVRWLLREGLLDQLNLLVHPIVVGQGMARLFPPDATTLQLDLSSSQTLESGVLNLTYTPAKG